VLPGTVAVFTLADPVPPDLTLAGFQQEAGFYHWPQGTPAGRTVALLAVPLQSKPGLVPLRLSWAGGTRQQWTNVVVGADTYPRIHALRVPRLKKKLQAAAADNEKEILEDAEAQALGGPPLWHGSFQWPLDGPIVVTSPFGVARVYNHGEAEWRHQGLDLRAPEGTPVLAANDGTVLLARRRLHATGGTVVVGHGYGLCSSYFHMRKVLVHRGEAVTKGQVLGLSGSTGLANGPHLHWQMDLRGIAVQPEQWLKAPLP
jgi:murein DD-endopeptidase MepM/ murein hydrolase activator NlpD